MGTTKLSQCSNKNIHMIGIGGSSMSGLAEFLLNKGYMLTGSDREESPSIEKLRRLGVKISIGHDGKNIENPDLVVYTVAIKSDNPEYLEAKKRNIPIIDRSVLLGEIMQMYPKTVSVSGTHGKTTTTSMIASILSYAGKKPNVHIGGKIKGMDSNVIIGGSEFFVNEACEYYNSFLHFNALIGVILNIEADHLDFFGSIDDLVYSFGKFASIIAEQGCLVVCKDSQKAVEAAKQAKCKVIEYSMEDSSAEYHAENIKFGNNGEGRYDLYKENNIVCSVTLTVPGRHNVSNSIAAAIVGLNLGCTPDQVKLGLTSFTGTARRFEIKGSYNNITVVDDYAHHPTEIKATINAAKNSKYNNIWVAFQPHTYTRAKNLHKEFSEAFKECYKVVVADIYAAREKDPGDINSQMLTNEINEVSNNAIYCGELEKVAEYIKNNAQPGDIVISAGAGTINQVCDMLLN